MNKRGIVPLVILSIIITLFILLIPFKQVLLFTEQKTNEPKEYYIPLENDLKFIIRYVHSIFLTDVFETYEVTDDQRIRLMSMTYENIGIGLPGSAGVGETFSVIDGLYTLSYDERVIDSFIMFIATVDAALAIQYEGIEVNLKEALEKGKSYKVSIEKQSFYQLMRGVNINVEK